MKPSGWSWWLMVGGWYQGSAGVEVVVEGAVVVGEGR